MRSVILPFDEYNGGSRDVESLDVVEPYDK